MPWGQEGEAGRALGNSQADGASEFRPSGATFQLKGVTPLKFNQTITRRGLLWQVGLAGLGIGILKNAPVFSVPGKGKGKRMFTGNLKSWRNLKQAQPFKAGFEFLEKNDLASLSPGRHDIEGDSLYAMVQKASSRAPQEGKFESHRKYIDIQCLVSGEEIIGVTPVEKLAVATPYDEKKDVAFYAFPAKYDQLRMLPGDFVVLFPEDGHLPLCHSGGPHELFKVVLKVSLEYWEKHQQAADGKK